MNFSIDKENYIDLSVEKEKTLYNLGPITNLFIGNGLMVEITARIETINYRIEYTDKIVNSAK
jgi:hypothetical protein